MNARIVNSTWFLGCRSLISAEVSHCYRNLGVAWGSALQGVGMQGRGNHGLNLVKLYPSHSRKISPLCVHVLIILKRQSPREPAVCWFPLDPHHDAHRRRHS